MQPACPECSEGGRQPQPGRQPIAGPSPADFDLPLSAVGFSCRLPHGAFYAFPNTKKTGWESRKLAEAMLNEAGVACLSGTAFGAFGEGYLRFSIANSMENLDEALKRIGSWANKNL